MSSLSPVVINFFQTGSFLEKEMVKLRMVGADQVKVKRRRHCRQRESYVQRFNGDKDMKHLEMKGATVRDGREWRQMRPGRGSSCTALRA